jgi:hypothetical protein
MKIEISMSGSRGALAQRPQVSSQAGGLFFEELGCRWLGAQKVRIKPESVVSRNIAELDAR